MSEYKNLVVDPLAATGHNKLNPAGVEAGQYTADVLEKKCFNC